MDAARPTPESETQAAFVHGVVEPAVRHYRAGDREGAVDTFFRGVFGSDYGGALERGLPGAFDRAVSDADAFFGQELPALQGWTFTEADARRVTKPVLMIGGEHSAETFPERHELLRSWLPGVEAFELPGATHLLHLQNARGTTEALSSFFARHPISLASTVAPSRSLR